MDRCCEKCKEMHGEKDFYGNQKYPNLCYRCLYYIKVSLLPKIRKCKICEEIIPNGKWSYCSDTCALMGAQDLKKNYWTKGIRTSNLGYWS